MEATHMYQGRLCPLPPKFCLQDIQAQAAAFQECTAYVWQVSVDIGLKADYGSRAMDDLPQGSVSDFVKQRSLSSAVPQTAATHAALDQADLIHSPKFVTAGLLGHLLSHCKGEEFHQSV